jgi:pteridine reductase
VTTPERRVSLVTGSGKRRVGWHVADALAVRGHAIAVHYQRSADAALETVAHLRSHGVLAESFGADLADEAAVDLLIGEVLARFGRLDVLVNTAATWQSKPLEDVTASDLCHHFNANVLGTFLCARRAGLAMVGQPDGGCIINFGDWAEARPYTHYAAYFASKGAIPTLTRCLAVELGLRNPRVRVNAILPGPVMVPDEVPDAERRRILEATLARREGRPEDVAQAVLALVENTYVTGVCLPVDGGRTVFAGGT